MTDRSECWSKYANHLKLWYVGTYRGHLGSTRAINDGRLIRKIAKQEHDRLTYKSLKDGGVSEFGAKTVLLYITNTKESYMKRCVTNTGGFDPGVECMSDNDCPRGYRCRGRGQDSECIESGEEPEVTPPAISVPDIKIPSLDAAGFGDGIKRSLQTTGLILMAFVVLLIYLVFVRGRGASGVTVGKVG